MDYKHTLDYLGNQVESPQDIIPKGIRRCDDPLLCIPRDLALHWGPLYKSNHYGEWHYFSMIGGKRRRFQPVLCGAEHWLV